MKRRSGRSLRRQSRCLLGLITTLLALGFVSVAAADDADRNPPVAESSTAPAALRTQERSRLWGGETLGAGHAITLQASAGFDVNGLISPQVGYSVALNRRVDLGIAVDTIAGVGWALGGSARLRVHLFDYGSLHGALEVPFSVDAYVDTQPPHLLVFGFQPGLVLSNGFGRNFEIFYALQARVFSLSDIVIVGPQVRAGAALSFRFVSFFVAGNASYLVVTDARDRPAWSLELGAAIYLGGS